MKELHKSPHFQRNSVSKPKNCYFFCAESLIFVFQKFLKIIGIHQGHWLFYIFGIWKIPKIIETVWEIQRMKQKKYRDDQGSASLLIVLFFLLSLGILHLGLWTWIVSGTPRAPYSSKIFFVALVKCGSTPYSCNVVLWAQINCGMDPYSLKMNIG